MTGSAACSSTHLFTKCQDGVASDKAQVVMPDRLHSLVMHFLAIGTSTSFDNPLLFRLVRISRDASQ